MREHSLLQRVRLTLLDLLHLRLITLIPRRAPTEQTPEVNQASQRPLYALPRGSIRVTVMTLDFQSTT
ncbi:MAG: hypothetical protein Q8O47_04575 [Candidatus Bathyarchaeota archaeon]|nr:hypothetical protein [Candidatus Bathyarchaeota archaeon]